MRAARPAGSSALVTEGIPTFLKSAISVCPARSGSAATTRIPFASQTSNIWVWASRKTSRVSGGAPAGSSPPPTKITMSGVFCTSPVNPRISRAKSAYLFSSDVIACGEVFSRRVISVGSGGSRGSTFTMFAPAASRSLWTSPATSASAYGPETRATSTPCRLLATMTSDMPSSTPCCSAICSSCLPISSCCRANWRWMPVISASIRSLTTPRSAIATPSRIPIARAKKTEMREIRWYLRSGTSLDAQEEAQFYREYLEDVGEGVGGVNDRRDRHQAGDDERDELPHRDARGVELADPLGVHQAGPDLQAGQEGG